MGFGVFAEGVDGAVVSRGTVFLHQIGFLVGLWLFRGMMVVVVVIDGCGCRVDGR